MIVECEKCGTKYRFDESLIIGEGVRVRCTRCNNVFFLENPSREGVVPPVEVTKEKEFPDFDDMTEEKEPLDIEIEKTAEPEIEKELSDIDDITEEKEPFDIEIEKTAEPEIEEKLPDLGELPEEKEPLDIEIEKTAEPEIEEKLSDLDDMTEEKEPVETEMEEKLEGGIKEEATELDDSLEEKEPVETEMEEKLEGGIKEEATELDDSLEEKEPVETEIEEKLEGEIKEEATEFDDSMEEKEPVETEMEGDEEEEEKEKIKKHLWTPKKILAYVVIVILVLGGVYMLLFPQIGKHVLDKISHYMSTDTLEKQDKITEAKKVGTVNFVNVKERLIKNFILGDLLVIQGTVINKYEQPISTVKVRGKLLNTAKEVLDEVESYCGNILTDEELGHLTGKEIAQELSIQIGSDVSNDNIAPEGEIPFMIVFTNPPKEAVEFIVELAKN